MTRIELTSEEAALLGEICEDYVSDLRAEIAGTDLMDFREQLKQREQFVKSLLKRLQSAA